ncbi:MAG: hypothetical protein RL722_2569 [Pseudomonadota bacterium]|jgi:predicted TIM-barrel fold metal-dependent hydrolase
METPKPRMPSNPHGACSPAARSSAEPLAGGLTRRRLQQAALLGLAGALGLARSSAAQGTAATPLPLVDAHVHYSHDAWSLVPPPQAIEILRGAGLVAAFVSSSNDQGTQMLIEAARAAGVPDLIIPELRPYRLRSDVGTWVREPEITRYMEERLARHRYVGVGEFHLYGEDAELPVPRRMVALAREHGLVLHAHSDVAAVERLFRQWPEARILWAHSGFEPPTTVREVLRRHPRLWADLAYRSDPGSSSGSVDGAWREAFEEFPTRFMVGTDTFTPERWHAIAPHASTSRAWLAALPPALAAGIASKNALALLRPGAGGPG